MGKEGALRRIRVVFDTNVLILAWLWEGNESRLVELAQEGAIEGYTSPQILRELTEALRYPKFTLSDGEIETACGYYALTLKAVDPKREVDAVGDAQDNRVIECAVEAKADYVVSGDRHLLALGEFEGIRIVRARELLQELVRPR